MPIKTIVCLANSAKHWPGRCIAGKELTQAGHGAWIRPVSARTTSEISLQECQYGNGSYPQLLDIIEIPIIRPVPHLHQTENLMIDSQHSWIKRGSMPFANVGALVDNPSSLWINNAPSSACITANAAANLTNSLELIVPDDLTIRVQRNPFNGKRKTRAHFKYRGVRYDLGVTDPAFQRPLGDYVLQDVYLCISLAEAFERDNCCYKLVAAIITP